MKTIKNYLYLLMAGAFVMFSACGELEDPADQEPFDPTSVANLYLVSTYNPAIGTNQVTFKGNLKNAEATVEYGFMWYVKPSGQQEPQVYRVVVGSGDIEGDFEKVMNDLPKGLDLVVCAFVDFKVSAQQVINNIGEEIDFTYD